MTSEIIAGIGIAITLGLAALRFSFQLGKAQSSLDQVTIRLERVERLLSTIDKWNEHLGYFPKPKMVNKI
jgi:hypothetical protein